MQGVTTKDEQVSRCGQAVRQRLRVAILSPGVEKHRRDSRWGWRWRNESQWASSPRRSNPRGSRCSPFALGSEVDPRITRPSPPPTCYQSRARLKPPRKALRDPCRVSVRHGGKFIEQCASRFCGFPKYPTNFSSQFPLTPLAQLKFQNLLFLIFLNAIKIIFVI